VLSIGKVGAGNWRYYQNSVAAGLEDYYAGEGESPGRWMGRADLIGATLGADVTEAEASLVLASRIGPDGTMLGRAPSARSVNAFDATFSAPKSVSVLYALGDPGVTLAVTQAQDAAVAAGLEYLDAHASFTRMGQGGSAVVDSDGLVALAYRHRTSRSLDPQLHDHVLVVNGVRTEVDGKWRTIDGRQFYRQAKAAGTVYQAALRSELMARLGVRFGPVSEHGQADIVGIDPDLMATWSTRSDDIEGELVAWVADFTNREGREPTPAEVGKAHKTFALATRDTKLSDASLETDTLRDRWTREAVNFGTDIDDMIAAACSHEAPIPWRVVDVDQIIADVAEKRSNWADAHLTQAIASHIVGGSAGDVLDTVEQLRTQILSSVEVVELAPDTIDNAQSWAGQRRQSDGRPVWVAPSTVHYTTRTQLAREQEIVDWATTDTTGLHRAIVAGIPDNLDDGQAATVNSLTQHPTMVATVVGPAGSGKTRMLRTATDAWAHAGIGVYGLAPTARAADELQHGAGIRADTIDKLQYEHAKPAGPDPDYQLAAGTVVVVDEAGMVDTAKLWAYSRLANSNGWRTVLVGDHQQLGSVNAGGMFAELVHDPDVTTHTLTELHRFTESWEAQATLRLRDSDPTVVNDYDHHGRLHDHRDPDAAIQHVARHGARLHTNGVDALVLTHTRAVAQRLNTAITDTLLESGHLDPATGFDIEGRTFHPGQRVMARRNNRHIRPTPTSDDYVRNGDRFTIIGPQPLDGLNVATSNREIVPIPASYVADGHLDIAYASTIHAAQGATVDETHTLATPTMGGDALYVAMSRGRHANHIHLTPPAFEPDQQHGPLHPPTEQWTAQRSFVEICHNTRPTLDTAIDRRRQLRHANIDQTELERRRLAAREVAAAAHPTNVDPAVASTSTQILSTPSAAAGPEHQAAALVEQSRHRRADEQHRQKMLNTIGAPIELGHLPDTTQTYIRTKQIEALVGCDSIDHQVAADLQLGQRRLTVRSYTHAHVGLIDYLASHNNMTINDYVNHANEHLVPRSPTPHSVDLAANRLRSIEHNHHYDGPGLDL
jgi:conjugative relaxase-like TrwC/TraI family protein